MARSVTDIEILIINLSDLISNDLYLGSLNAAGITSTVCFDCSLWLNGYKDSDGSFIIQPVRTTVINDFTAVQIELDKILKDSTITDYGFKTQVQRFLEIITNLLSKISSLQCSPYMCNSDIISEFLSTLITTICQTITTLEYLNGLLSYYEYCDCMGISLFSILMGKFINAITELQSYIKDWYDLVIIFFQLTSVMPKDYVASYVAKSTIQIPPYNIPTSHACVPCPVPKQPIIQKQPSCNIGNGFMTFPC